MYSTYDFTKLYMKRKSKSIFKPHRDLAPWTILSAAPYNRSPFKFSERKIILNFKISTFCAIKLNFGGEIAFLNFAQL